ncbi:MAG: cytidine deaminase [Pedosphaera sp.]|nr:cytidine deaminase [Pedosphaera sp.]
MQNKLLVKLCRAAAKARSHSYSPYSSFRVGAALALAGSTRIVTGANVESASYGLTCCAERVALFKAITDGHRRFRAIAIASPGGAMPCGACRQLLAEHAPDAVVVVMDTRKPHRYFETRVADLLPLHFDGSDLTRRKSGPRRRI